MHMSVEQEMSADKIWDSLIPWIGIENSVLSVTLPNYFGVPLIILNYGVGTVI
jgi:hypothetical protein